MSNRKHTPKIRITPDNYYRLLSLAEKGSDAEFWYPRAYADILRFSRSFGFEAGYVADIVAILSPRCAVVRNARLAVNHLLYNDNRTIMKQRIEAIERYKASFGTDLGKGPKVSAFSKNLRGNFEPVTIDVWIARAFNRPHSSFADLDNYRTGSEAICNIAADLGVSPSSAQAMIWSGVRKEYGKRGNLELSLCDCVEYLPTAVDTLPARTYSM